ncbi:MAG: aminotransferase class V-fold PLP-dependent enzyme [Rhizobiales bacterium]|nr:aminotransferase class V-fold PLP-dependent enzyme [Hyphomicrobiales bacterium]
MKLRRRVVRVLIEAERITDFKNLQQHWSLAPRPACIQVDAAEIDGDRFIDRHAVVGEVVGFQQSAVVLLKVDEHLREIATHVTFHAGHRFDIESIGRLAHDKKLYFVIDAMQSVGVVPLDARAAQASLVAFGCHKGLYVPQGMGALYVRKGLAELQPAYLAVAGLANPPADLVARVDNMQLREDAGRFEIGNFNLPDIHALAASLSSVERLGVEQIYEHVLALGDRLIEHLDRLDVGLVGPRERKHRSHIYVLNLPAQEWVEYLAGENVRVSPERDGIRVSFGFFNTLEDVDLFAAIIARRQAGG